MAFCKRVPWIEIWRIGKARLVYSCEECQINIKKSETRIALKNQSSFAYHISCWETEYGRDSKDIPQ